MLIVNDVVLYDPTLLLSHFFLSFLPTFVVFYLRFWDPIWFLSAAKVILLVIILMNNISEWAVKSMYQRWNFN